MIKKDSTKTQSKISIFKPVNKSSSCIKAIDVEKALNVIKGEDNSFIELINKARQSGKNNPEKKFSITRGGKPERVNEYTFIKSTKIWSFNWLLNLNRGEKRRLNSLRDDAFSGYMYFDVDDIFIDLPIDEIKKLVFELDSVKAVWKSISNEGLGFLVKVDGLNTSNARPTWSHCAITFTDMVNEKIKIAHPDLCFKYNKAVKDEKIKGAAGVYFKIDPAVKDITRLNIISYDPEILIRDTNDVNPIQAIEKEQYEQLHPQAKDVKLNTNRIRRDISDSVNKNALKTPSELEKMHLEFTFDNLYNNKEKWSGNRLSYVFHRDFYAATNKLGIDLDVAFDFCVRKKADNPDLALFDYRDENDVYNGIASNIYEQYEDQFGSAIHENENYDNYIIKNINVSFKGTYRDAEFYMGYLHYDVCKKARFDEKSIYHFVKAVKEKGIAYKDMLSYLINKKTKEAILKKAENVYSNTYIAFGIVLEEKGEAKKKRKAEQDAIAFSNGKEIKQNAIDHTIDDKYIDGLDFEKHPEQSLFLFIKRTITLFTLNETAWSYLKEIEEFKGVENGLKAVFDDVVREYDYMRGCEYVVAKVINYNEFLHFRNHYKISKGQYLNDLDLQPTDRQILYSSTGSGKTTWGLETNKEKTIFLVPTTALADSNGYKKGVKAYHEKKKKINLKDHICSTYPSFPALIKDIFKLGGNPYEYTLIVDEAQNFVSSASKEFRLDEMTYIYNVMNKFKKVIHLSGTWYNLIAPNFEGYTIDRIEKENEQRFKYVDYSQKHVSVEKLCDKNGLNVVFLQSKKFEKQLGTYREYFKQKGWDEKEMLFVNAGTKDEVHIKRLLKKKRIPDNYKAVFITSFAAEGLDLYNEDVKSLHFASDEHPMMMQQIANRFRKVAPKMIYVYRSVDKQYKHMEFGDRVEEQKAFSELVNQSLSIVNNKMNRPFFGKLFNDHFYYEKEDGDLDINYLSIANAIYNREKSYANNNETYMIQALEYYNWVFEGRISVEDKAEKKIEKALKDFRKIEKEKIYEEQKKIFEHIEKNETLDDVKNIVEKKGHSEIVKNSNLPDFEYSVRKKILTLCRYTTYEYALKVVNKWIINTGASKIAWKRLMNSFEVIKRKYFHFHDGAVDLRTKFYQLLKREIVEVQKRGDKGKLYFDHHLIDLVNSLRIGSENVIPEVKTMDEAYHVLSDYLFLEETVDSRGKRRLKFGAIKLINEESYLYNAIYHFANYHLKSGKSFTKESFRTYLSEKKNNLIYGSHEQELNHYNAEKAFEILRMFCDVEKDINRMYVVTNLGSNLLGQIEWRDDIVEIYDEEKMEMIL